MRSKIVENKLSEAYNLLIDYVKEHKKIFINIMQSDKGYDVVDYSFHTSTFSLFGFESKERLAGWIKINVV